MTKNKFYITSAIPYVNAKPHIGHALEFVQADTIARYHKILGDEVLYLCGSDENALKNVQAAEDEGIKVQELVNKNAKLFQILAQKLDVSFDVFQKGSSKEHHKSSQKLWELCSHDTYKKKYRGLYCVGCEAFYTLSELDEKGECYEHPGKKIEEVEEENYFFKLSKYQDKLLKIIESNEYEIVPTFRKNEVLQFIKQGLEDFSISRTNERAKNWGVPVPNDPSQRIYVWVDGLNIYQSGIGFGWDEKNYKKWWPADLHVIGKGIIRFHAIYWPAILLSAGLPLPKKLFVHEYLTVNGQKMSKTLGNVIDPLFLAQKYGKDALRYFLLAKVSSFADSDFSEEKLKEAYNSDLANGLGNLVARVAKLCDNPGFSFDFMEDQPKLQPAVEKYLKEFKFNEALNWIWETDIKQGARIEWGLRWLDRKINEEKPWGLPKELLKLKLDLFVAYIRDIAFNLKPFLPETAEKIEEQFKGPKIKSQKPLFPRL